MTNTDPNTCPECARLRAACKISYWHMLVTSGVVYIGVIASVCVSLGAFVLWVLWQAVNHPVVLQEF